MSYYSEIEWTDTTWNPVAGCTKVSKGCDHCYAERIAERFRGTLGHPYSLPKWAPSEKCGGGGGYRRRWLEKSKWGRFVAGTGGNRPPQDVNSEHFELSPQFGLKV